MDVVVENLTKSFGYQKAVDSVSFEVKKGAISLTEVSHFQMLHNPQIYLTVV